MSYPSTSLANRLRPSLRVVLIVPFILQIFTAVGLTGYLSLAKERLPDLMIWKYEEITPKISSIYNINKTTNSEELIPPSNRDLQILLELAQDGMLTTLIETAEKIGRKSDRYQPFIEEIIQLAKKFQTEKIEMLIQKHLAVLTS